MSTPVIDHPFFDDFAAAYEAAAVRKPGPDDWERIRQLYCSVYPESILSIHWPGWQLGIPRPDDTFPNAEKMLELWALDVAVLLLGFFQKVRQGEVYCDPELFVQDYGLTVEDRIGKSSGLHYNLENAYWTFCAKLRRWIGQNIRVYDCSLVCDLDEILARADSFLRGHFFPTPGRHDMGPQKRKLAQVEFLRVFAPDFGAALLSEMYGQGPAEAGGSTGALPLNEVAGFVHGIMRERTRVWDTLTRQGSQKSWWEFWKP